MHIPSKYDLDYIKYRFATCPKNTEIQFLYGSVAVSEHL